MSCKKCASKGCVCISKAKYQKLLAENQSLKKKLKTFKKKKSKMNSPRKRRFSRRRIKQLGG
tara:strand:+ start:754 stop:939 length:186 start_codon:yes stop_codon:yes gene_type:complete